MTSTLDDPRLTAYALDELNTAEREEIGRILQDSSDHRREVEEIEVVAGLLARGLRAEALPEFIRAPLPVADERGNRRSRAAVFALAASGLLVVGLGLVYLFQSEKGTGVFAQTVEQIVQAKAITWKTTFYTHASSKDGKSWLLTETRQVAYKAPGLYRETFFDDKGEVRYVEITDAIHDRKLGLNVKEEKAVMSESAGGLRDPKGPWASFMSELKANNLQWVENRNMPTGDVNIFRRSMWDAANNRAWSYDFWIDAKTRRLVELHVPGEDIYDPDKDPTRDNKPGKKWMETVAGGGFIDHDIVYDTTLDDSLFSLSPPAGYELTTEDRPKVTEQQMIDYFGIVAEYNDKTFPDQVFPFIFSSDRLNKIWDKPKNDRTAAEQKLLDTDNYYEAEGLYALPIGQFVQDSVVEGSFRYLGKGVKLGDVDRIVCWYRLKGADTYRVVYGDLRAKDISPEALPLPDQP